MAGGTWTRQNKTLPGFYLNIKSAAVSSSNYGKSGIMAICEPLSWGPVAQITKVDFDTDVFHTLGYDLDTSDEMLFLREIFLGSVNADGSARSAGAAAVLIQPHKSSLPFLILMLISGTSYYSTNLGRVKGSSQTPVGELSCFLQQCLNGFWF